MVAELRLTAVTTGLPSPPKVATAYAAMVFAIAASRALRPTEFEDDQTQ